MKKAYLLVAGGVVASFVAGFGGGYYFTKRKLEQIYSEVLDEEIARTKEHYKMLVKKDEWGSPEEAAAALGLEFVNVISEEEEQELKDTIANMRYSSTDMTLTVDDTDEAKALVKNIFEGGEEVTDEDWEEEVNNRNEVDPYIITDDEFAENEFGFAQESVVFFAGDGILSDDKDEQIPDIKSTVGEDNVTRFGHRSNDPNVVYVRNHRIQMDFEITRHTGAYRTFVMGYDTNPPKTSENVRKGPRRR